MALTANEAADELESDGYKTRTGGTGGVVVIEDGIDASGFYTPSDAPDGWKVFGVYPDEVHLVPESSR